jgi:hypothetical protein
LKPFCGQKQVAIAVISYEFENRWQHCIAGGRLVCSDYSALPSKGIDYVMQLQINVIVVVGWAEPRVIFGVPTSENNF